MIRNWLRNFMVGRYGPDQLNVALLVVTVIFYIANAIFGLFWLSLCGYVFIFAAFFRMLSRNIPKRRAENDRFLRFWWPVRQKIKGFFTRIKSRKQYRFFRCPACKNTLRVPTGKGKIQITCPKCGERFQRKT